jgi:hypothetical protein
MPIANKVVEELMDYIKKNYQLTNDVPEENHVSAQISQTTNTNFEDIVMELTQYISHKRNHVTFINLLERYKTQRNMTDSDVYKNA